MQYQNSTLFKSLLQIILPIFAATAVVMAPRTMAFVFPLVGSVLFFLNKDARTALIDFIKNKYVIAFVLILALIISTNCAFSIDQSLTIKRLIKIGIIVVPGIIAYHLFKWGHPIIEKPGFLICFIIGWIIASSVIMTDHLLGFPLLEFIGYTGKDLRPHHNRSVVAVLTLLPILITGLLLYKNKSESNGSWQIWIISSLIILLSVGLFVMTDSQSAQLGLLAGIIGFMSTLRHKFFWIVVKAAVMLLLIGTPFLIEALYNFIITQEELLSMDIIRHAATGQRIEIWYALTQLALEKPILGHGIGTTRLLTFETQGYFWDKTSVLHPHNFAVQLWLEAGLLGIIFCCFSLTLILRAIENIENNLIQRLAFMQFLTWLSVAATGYGFWQSWWVGASVTLMCLWAYILNSSQKD